MLIEPGIAPRAWARVLLLTALVLLPASTSAQVWMDSDWQYRQPLAWSALRLFNDGGRLEHRGAVAMSELYLQKQSQCDSEFVRTAQEVVGAKDREKKAKILPDASFSIITYSMLGSSTDHCRWCASSTTTSPK